MCISLKKHLACEKRSFQRCIKEYPKKEKIAKKIISRLKYFFNLNHKLKILEIGSAQGAFLITCKKLGYSCQGIEPSEKAIRISKKLSKELGIKTKITKGTAEKIPYSKQKFDIIIVLSVLEHVTDIKKSLNEISRVLKKKGAIYFTTISTISPKQGEIRFFPCFSWYPIKIKRKIMNWAKKYRPDLIGYTKTPAIHWFSPKKWEKILKELEFTKIYDRWDLILPNEFNSWQKVLIKIIKTNKITKFIGDIIFPSCTFLAIR